MSSTHLPHNHYKATSVILIHLVKMTYIFIKFFSLGLEGLKMASLGFLRACRYGTNLE